MLAWFNAPAAAPTDCQSPRPRARSVAVTTAPLLAHLVGALEGRRERHQRVEAAAKVVGIAALDHLGRDRPMPSCL